MYDKSFDLFCSILDTLSKQFLLILLQVNRIFFLLIYFRLSQSRMCLKLYQTLLLSHTYALKLGLLSQIYVIGNYFIRYTVLKRSSVFVKISTTKSMVRAANSTGCFIETYWKYFRQTRHISNYLMARCLLNTDIIRFYLVNSSFLITVTRLIFLPKTFWNLLYNIRNSLIRVFTFYETSSHFSFAIFRCFCIPEERLFNRSNCPYDCTNT
jgi:hypothetical protein